VGDMKHEAVIVTTGKWRPGGLPDMDGFRASLPEEFRHLVIGPVRAARNDYVSYVFLPDGIKEEQDASDLGDAARERFKDLFRHLYEDGTSTDEWAHVVIADDHDEVSRVVEQHPPVGSAVDADEEDE